MSAVFRFRTVPADWPSARPARRSAPNAEPADLRISVVVPANGQVPPLMRCLQALLAQNVNPHSFEILVVDPARDKATRQAVQALARTLPPHLLHYLRPLDQLRSPAAARNRGWRAARAPLVAFTDAHVVPEPDWLLEGDKAMHTTRCIALAGRVLVQRAGDHGPVRLQLAHPARHEPPPAVLDSANTFVWRKALQAVGGFDDRFPDPAHELADLQRRLQREGPVGRSDNARVFQPTAHGRWRAALVPVLAAYWRLRGERRYRVRFA